ncbi:MAG: VOC family protein [Candidatus Heimdallarchaeaceae archaeon]
MIVGIDVIFIHARDPKKLAEWYKETLEIDIGSSTPDLGWQEFELSENRPATRFAIDYGESYPSIVEQQPIIISFKVENILEVIKNLEGKGIEFYGTPKINDVGPTLVATFQDIEGNWIQISQRKS